MPWLYRDTTIWIPRLPAVVLGLFWGRLLSEGVARLLNYPIPLVLAFMITISTTAVSLLWLRRRSFAQLWPLLGLLLYVLAPQLDPLLLALALLFTLLLWVIPTLRRMHDVPAPLTGALLAAAGFTLYAATLAPGVMPADNGEFQLVLAQLGVAHPPGFPLYTLLGHGLIRLATAVPPALAANLFAAITSSLTLLVVYLTGQALLQNGWAAAAGTVALATATTFWAQATMANIRSLTALFAALMFWALVNFQQETADDRPTADGWLLVFALAFGFGVTHHPSLAFIGLVCLFFILLVDVSFLTTPRRWLRPLLGGLAGLLPFLYLPLRANAAVPGASPDLATWPGFVEHALALGFRGDLFAFLTPALLWERLRIMGNVMGLQFHPLLLAGMALGFILMLWRQRRLAFLFGGAFFIHTFITATYRAPQTVEYMLPAYVAAAILLAYTAAHLPLPANFRVFTWAARVIVTAAIIVLAIWQGIERLPSFQANPYAATETDMAQLLTTAPTDAVILAHWHWATPLWYLQQVEGLRPDVTVRYVAPGGEPYTDTWVRRTEEELANGRAVITTHFDADSFAALPPPQPSGDAFLFSQTAQQGLPTGFTPADSQIADVARIYGLHLDKLSVTAGSEATLTIAWQPLDDSAETVPLYVHLLGPNGRLAAQDDLTLRPQPSGLTLTQFRLTPRPGTTGEGDLLLGSPQSDDPAIPIGSLPITKSTWPAATTHPLYRPAIGEQPLALPPRRLVGYDWDTTLPDQTRLYLHWSEPDGYTTTVYDNPVLDELALPALIGPWGLTTRLSWLLGSPRGHYVPFGAGIVWTGNPLSADAPDPRPGSRHVLAQHFLSREPLARDTAVSVRLIGYESDNFTWAWTDLQDGIPALGAIPTLKWIDGSRVRDPHFVTVSPDASSGQSVGATLVLYDVFSNRRLPILDERITRTTPWVPLGENTAVR